MARSLIPSQSKLWQIHRYIYTSVFSDALELLSLDSPDTTSEDNISESLNPFLHQVCFERNKKTGDEIRVPDWEKPIQPVTHEEVTGERRNKRPDFTCKLVNTFATSVEEGELSLHVECKCLGNPTSRSWNLNKNYVVDGIVRFDSKTHKYGLRADSGIMIGYIVSMSPDTILDEVNVHFKSQYPNDPEIKFAFNGSKVQYCQQKLSRKEVKPVAFELDHLWADFRSN